MSYPLNYYQHFLETLKPKTHTRTRTGVGGGGIFLSGDKAMILHILSCAHSRHGAQVICTYNINNDVKFSCTSLIK